MVPGPRPSNDLLVTRAHEYAGPLLLVADTWGEAPRSPPGAQPSPAQRVASQAEPPKLVPCALRFPYRHLRRGDGHTGVHRPEDANAGYPRSATSAASPEPTVGWHVPAAGASCPSSPGSVLPSPRLAFGGWSSCPGLTGVSFRGGKLGAQSSGAEALPRAWEPEGGCRLGTRGVLFFKVLLSPSPTHPPPPTKFLCFDLEQPNKPQIPPRRTRALKYGRKGAALKNSSLCPWLTELHGAVPLHGQQDSLRGKGGEQVSSHGPTACSW